jgi:hypothetical protein
LMLARKGHALLAHALLAGAARASRPRNRLLLLGPVIGAMLRLLVERCKLVLLRLLMLVLLELKAWRRTAGVRVGALKRLLLALRLKGGGRRQRR